MKIKVACSSPISTAPSKYRAPTSGSPPLPVSPVFVSKYKQGLQVSPGSFPNPLYVGRPNIGDRQSLARRIEQMLDRRWLSNDGPLVREFEAAIASYVGVKHCIAVCNATVGLEIVSRALGLRGDVIDPAYTFVATAHAFRWQEIRPVFADIIFGSHNVDPKCIEHRITNNTTAIVATHVWGRPCDTDMIEAIAAKHGLPVIYDAAHAFGCSHQGRTIGGFGSCEVFSFHATKFLNSFEGGAVTTNDDALAEKLRLMRNFGFQGFDNVIHLGINGKMSEVHAAMGLTNLEAIDELINVNQRNYQAYRHGLENLPGIALIDYDLRERNNYQYIVIEVDPDVCPRPRDEIVAYLHTQNVIARKYFWPGVHRMEPYRSEQPETSLPQTDRIGARVVVLPTGQSMSVECVAGVCELISNLLR